MEVKSYSKLFFGILFVVFGLVGIFNLWDFFAVNLPWQVWPVGLIVVGILFMVRQKGLAFVVVGLLIVLGIFSNGFDIGSCIESGEFGYEFGIEGVEYVDLILDYGVGSVNVSKGNDVGISFDGTTSGFSEPFVDKSIEENRMKLYFGREDSANACGDHFWEIGLKDDIVYNLDLDYGVADVDLDFRGLNVSKLKISGGVSDTRIVFGEYPSDVEIQGGVSDFSFEFLEGTGVVIKADGGLVGKDFDGFVKRDGKWYSEGYDAAGENIIVRFNGGVGDLKADFYS